LSWLGCNLKAVDLTFNKLAGTISANTSTLNKLQVLGLGYNSA
jgi:hypothetical protein